MKTTLSAKETPLYKVFSDDYLFSIPPVQRPYSWTTDEVGELLDDLLDFIEHHGINEKNISTLKEPYFLGSIVLVKQDGPSSDVLDGQQRLTTLTILLAVLRDVLDGDYANELDAMIVQKGSKIKNTDDTFRLCLRNRDDDFIRNHIQVKGATKKITKETPAKTDSQKLIRDNAIYIMERLVDLDENTVKLLPSVIATLCYIVTVSTPNFDSAFRIFTVLNDRGLDLMTSDIFKARVIGAIPESEQNKYTDKWEEVEVSLGRERFNKLFDHIRMILQKRKGSANYKDEYNEIFSKITGKEFIDEILIPYGEIYLKLVDYRSYYSEQPELIKILSLLNRIDNNDWIPPTMFYINHINRDIHMYLNRIEVFAGTSMILRKNFNWRMSKYSQILREMDNGIDVFDRKSTLEVTNEDKIELLEKLEGDVYTDLKDTAKRYLLLRLDSLLTHGQPFYDHSVITVEHVLPQTPKEDSEWLKNFEDPSEYVHKLGNLVLLTRIKNSQARNYDFQKKKTSYFESKNGISTFALTTQVIQETTWTPEVLEARQKKLIKLLMKAWNMDVDNLIKQPVGQNDNIVNQKFYIESIRGANAVSIKDDQGLKVLKGSYFAHSVSDSFPQNHKELRDELISNKVLVKEKEAYILIEDYVFNSPSIAAGLVMGRSANGLTEWKTDSGVFLKDIIE